MAVETAALGDSFDPSVEQQCWERSTRRLGSELLSMPAGVRTTLRELITVITKYNSACAVAEAMDGPPACINEMKPISSLAF